MLLKKPSVNGETLLRLWGKAKSLPGGTRVFSRMVGRMAPYTGTIGAQVLDLGPGYARLAMRDRRRVRNHLRSIHAIALINFLEETTGLAMVSRFPTGLRGIVTHIEIDYLHKARGTITAECHAPEIDEVAGGDYTVTAEIRGPDGQVVARGRAQWRIGPVQRAITAA